MYSTEQLVSYFLIGKIVFCIETEQNLCLTVGTGGCALLCVLLKLANNCLNKHINIDFEVPSLDIKLAPEQATFRMLRLKACGGYC